MSNYWDDENKIRRLAGITDHLVNPVAENVQSVHEADADDLDELDDDAYLDRRIAAMDADNEGLKAFVAGVKKTLGDSGFDAESVDVLRDEDVVTLIFDTGVAGMTINELAKLNQLFGHIHVVPESDNSLGIKYTVK